jgi:hypothetical protein
MNKYTLFWRNGNTEIVSGDDISDALRRSGYKNKNMGALDFHKDGNVTHLYEFNKVNLRWNLKDFDLSKI